MQFSFTEQQTDFRHAVRQMLDRECTPADVRAVFDAAVGPDGGAGPASPSLPSVHSARWQALAEMGVVGLTIPELHGGLGLTDLDLVLLLEEAGRAALPEPLLETTALAAPLLARTGFGPEYGTEIGALSNHWLPLIAGGDAVAAIGLAGMPAVPAAVGADLFILEYAPPGGDPEIHAVPADHVTVTPVSSLDPTRRLGTVEWTPAHDTLVAAGSDAASALAVLADRAAVGTAAAWSLAHRTPDAGRRASMAKAYASEAATEAARVSLQVHGAIGYTWECDLHLFLKRAWALAPAWGDAAEHRSRVLASVIDERAARP